MNERTKKLDLCDRCGKRPRQDGSIYCEGCQRAFEAGFRTGKKSIVGYNRDGICPRCRELPKVPGYPYCQPCKRRYRAEYAIRHKGPDRRCKDCGEPVDKGKTYCGRCGTQRKKDYLHKYYETHLKVKRQADREGAPDRRRRSSQPFCPDCGLRPKAIGPTGKMRARCLVCEGIERRKKRPANVSDRRSDGICPRCGIRPRRVGPTGKVRAYCTECVRERQRKKYSPGYISRRLEGICPRCLERPKAVGNDGKRKAYCLECRRERDSERREKRLAERGGLARAQARRDGICARCGERPRQVFNNGRVISHCRECNLQVRRERRTN